MNRQRASLQPILLLLSCLALLACGSDTHPPSADAATDPTRANIDGGAGEAGQPLASGIAVVNSDYKSTSISFLDRDGNVLKDKDGCFNSGSGPAGLAMTLSGNVDLPTQTPFGSPVVVIDRRNAVLTWLDPATCTPLGQLAVGTGFTAYPHDYVMLSPTKAYVTRYEENAAATAAPDDFDDGNDLLIVDPSQPKIVGRIDLKPYAPAGAGMLPRADRAVLAGGKVYVSLNAITGDLKHYGAGRIVVVDPALDQVVGTIDPPTVMDCGALAYSASDNRLLVACNGDYSAGVQQVASSAIVVIDLTATPPAVAAQIPASSVGTMPFSNWVVAPLDTTTVLAVSQGDFSNTPPDRLWALSLVGAAPAEVFTSTEAYALGAILGDPDKARLFVANGTTKSSAFVQTFAVASGTLTATAAIKANPSQKLPPRALAWY